MNFKIERVVYEHAFGPPTHEARQLVVGALALVFTLIKCVEGALVKINPCV
jgi:hypothetical protein